MIECPDVMRCEIPLKTRATSSEQPQPEARRRYPPIGQDHQSNEGPTADPICAAASQEHRRRSEVAVETSAKSIKPKRDNALWQVLFIQGGGEGAHNEWDGKLVASLRSELGPGYLLHYPKMPNEGDPSFEVWGTAIDRQISQLSGVGILVGHSIGGTILLHILCRRPWLLRDISAIHLIAAPFVGAGGWQSDEIVLGPDWAAPLAGLPVFLYQGDADTTTPSTHLDLYAATIPHAYPRHLDGRNHQMNDDLFEVAQDIRWLTGTDWPEFKR